LLNDEQIEKVRLVLMTAGWNEVMRPALLERGRHAMKALALTPNERDKEYKGSDYNSDDDVLRAMIRDCEWMVVVWENEINVFNLNRRREELVAQQNGAERAPAPIAENP